MPQYNTERTLNGDGSPRKKSRRLSRVEAVKALKIIDNVIVVEGEDDQKTHKYKLGWSDARVIEEMGVPDIPTNAIAVLRREFHGPCRLMDNNSRERSKDAIAKLVIEVAALTAGLGELKNKHNALLDRIGSRLGEGWPVLKQR